MAQVDVIIPTFNRARRVLRAVSSVLSQTFTDFEIYVVDDGSTDDTQEVLKRFKERIHYLGRPFNAGVSAARNLGIKKSTSPLIAFLDSDDYWLPRKLAFQVDFFRNRPQALICQTEEIWIRNGRRVNPKKRHAKPSGDIFRPSLGLCLVSPSAVMLKRSLLQEVGLFDETLPACEDYDLWLRIASRHPVALIPEPLVVKEGGHPDQLSSRHKGMDRFRIKALLNLIERETLTMEQLQATVETLAEKSLIYGRGCLKRGRTREARFYLQLPKRIEERFKG